MEGSQPRRISRKRLNSLLEIERRARAYRAAWLAAMRSGEDAVERGKERFAAHLALLDILEETEHEA